MVEATDGRYLKILEIEPINFMLRSDEEQFNIISTFASWLKISPMRLQFKSITRKADSDKHVAMVRKELEHEENEQCRSLGEGYIRLIKDVGSREALTRRFFLIFQYEELRRGDSEDVGQVYSVLQTAEQNARAYFLQCGNSIVQSADPDEAAAKILYMFFNRQSCVDEPFSARVNRVVLDTMAARGKVIGIDPVPKINVAHFLAPRGIDLTHFNHTVINDAGQTVEFEKPDEPQIKTTATVNGEKKAEPKGEVTIKDTVSYSGLTPGKTYKLSGVLMDKSTGSKLLVDGKEITAEKEFTSENASGTEEMTFTFDASTLAGKSVVVFETLYHDDKEVAVHTDITDKNQTVEFKER